MKPSCAVLIGAIALGGLTTGCASTGAVPRPFPMPGSTTRADPEGRDPLPEAEPSARVASDVYAVVGTALDLRGVRYRNGGSDRNGFDCSGFTQYVFAQHGLKLPRNVRDQFEHGTSIRPEEVQEGDLLFFAIEEPGASHVAIAVGGDSFVHAPSSSGVVRVERLSARYWAQRFVGARRVL